jgi:hypothetical protein
MIFNSRCARDMAAQSWAILPLPMARAQRFCRDFVKGPLPRALLSCLGCRLRDYLDGRLSQAVEPHSSRCQAAHVGSFSKLRRSK